MMIFIQVITWGSPYGGMDDTIHKLTRNICFDNFSLSKYSILRKLQTENERLMILSL